MIYPHTYEDKIGMNEIRALLRSHCLSPLGLQRVEEMKFLTDGELLRELHRQLGEYVRLQEETDGLPEQGYYDLRPTLLRIRIEGTYIEVDEMFQMQRSLETIEAIVEILKIEKLKIESFAETEQEEDNDSEEIPYPALTRMLVSRLTSHDKYFNISMFQFNPSDFPDSRQIRAREGQCFVRAGTYPSRVGKHRRQHQSRA